MALSPRRIGTRKRRSPLYHNSIRYNSIRYNNNSNYNSSDNSFRDSSGGGGDRGRGNCDDAADAADADCFKNNRRGAFFSIRRRRCDAGSD